jgi:hypothetical protein
MPSLDHLERQQRYRERKLRELEGKLAHLEMLERQAIEANAKPKRPPICAHHYRVLDRWSWPHWDERFVASSDWRPTTEETLRRVRQAKLRSSLR